MVKSWRKIRKINILGIIWTVKKARTLKEIDPKNRRSWGLLLPNDRKIVLYSKIPTERDFRLALLHEIGHALLVHLKPIFELSMIGLEGGKIDVPGALEIINDIHSKFLFQVLQDNDLLS